MRRAVRLLLVGIGVVAIALVLAELALDAAAFFARDREHAAARGDAARRVVRERARRARRRGRGRRRAPPTGAHVDIAECAHHDASVRTTVAIDDDLFEKLREAATRRREPFTKIVNETLRRGLFGQRPRDARRARFRVEPFDSPFRPGVDPLRLNQLVDDLEVQRATERPGS